MIKEIPENHVRLCLADGYTIDVPKEDYEEKQPEIRLLSQSYLEEKEILVQEVDLEQGIITTTKTVQYLPEDKTNEYSDAYRIIFGEDKRHG